MTMQEDKGSVAFFPPLFYAMALKLGFSPRNKRNKRPPSPCASSSQSILIRRGNWDFFVAEHREGKTGCLCFPTSDVLCIFRGRDFLGRSKGRAALTGAFVTTLRPASEAWILTLYFNCVTPEEDLSGEEMETTLWFQVKGSRSTVYVMRPRIISKIYQAKVLPYICSSLFKT